jgi:hypothetical protein
MLIQLKTPVQTQTRQQELMKTAAPQATQHGPHLAHQEPESQQMLKLLHIQDILFIEMKMN